MQDRPAQYTPPRIVPYGTLAELTAGLDSGNNLDADFSAADPTAIFGLSSAPLLPPLP